MSIKVQLYVSLVFEQFPNNFQHLNNLILLKEIVDKLLWINQQANIITMINPNSMHPINNFTSINQITLKDAI